MRFIRSTDMGNTFDPKISFTADPLGIGSDIVTDASGIIYYFYPGFGPRDILLKRSLDGGATFEPGTFKVSDTEGSFDYAIPVMDTRRVFIYVSADADLTGGMYSGSIYAAWTDSTGPEDPNPANNHSVIRVAYSRDQGVTWTVVTPHELGDVNDVDRFHQWLAVAVDGSVHVVFYDTRNSDNRDGVDFYHSFSTDGAQTFSVPQRLTTITSPEINDGFEWGDYNGLDHVVRQSTVFTDNRNEGGGGGDSEDIYSTTVLQGGINITMAPEKPSMILGPTTVCAGQDGIPFEATSALGAESYQWSFSDGSVTINDNGNQSITLDGITAAGGTLSVMAQNVCGDSSQEDLVINIASNAVCNVVDCVLNTLSIDNPTIVTADVFDIIQTIDSDATVNSGDTKIMRAGTSIEFTEGFTAEESSLLIAQIDDCSAALLEDEKE